MRGGIQLGGGNSSLDFRHFKTLKSVLVRVDICSPWTAVGVMFSLYLFQTLLMDRNSDSYSLDEWFTACLWSVYCCAVVNPQVYVFSFCAASVVLWY